MTSLTVSRKGEIAIPNDLRERYGLQPETNVRLIETRTGILLIPLTAEPMEAALQREIEEWQSLSDGSLAMFPYEDGAA